MRFIFTAVASMLLAAPAAAQPAPSYRGQEAAPANGTIDFCATGKFLLFTGNCYLPGDSPYKDSISAKACAGVNAVLTAGLSDLYPNARVYTYENLSADSLREMLMQSAVLGFFFIGEGDTSGGLMTGTDREAFYPAAESCVSLYDVFGGFTSHSKYSPDVPAPKRLRKRILAKTELIYRGAGRFLAEALLSQGKHGLSDANLRGQDEERRFKIDRRAAGPEAEAGVRSAEEHLRRLRYLRAERRSAGSAMPPAVRRLRREHYAGNR
jgi:hypothetical protein